MIDLSIILIVYCIGNKIKKNNKPKVTSCTVGHFGGGGGKPKSDEGEEGFSLFIKPKVTSSNVGHFWGRVGVIQKATKTDGVGVVWFIK